MRWRTNHAAEFSDGNKDGLLITSFAEGRLCSLLSTIAQKIAASSADTLPNASARRVEVVRVFLDSVRSKERDSDAQERGVENGTGALGTGRINASGIKAMNDRISERMLF